MSIILKIYTVFLASDGNLLFSSKIDYGVAGVAVHMSSVNSA